MTTVLANLWLSLTPCTRTTGEEKSQPQWISKALKSTPGQLSMKEFVQWTSLKVFLASARVHVGFQFLWDGGIRDTHTVTFDIKQPSKDVSWHHIWLNIWNSISYRGIKPRSFCTAGGAGGVKYLLNYGPPDSFHKKSLASWLKRQTLKASGITKKTVFTYIDKPILSNPFNLKIQYLCVCVCVCDF